MEVAAATLPLPARFPGQRARNMPSRPTSKTVSESSLRVDTMGVSGTQASEKTVLLHLGPALSDPLRRPPAPSGRTTRPAWGSIRMRTAEKPTGGLPTSNQAIVNPHPSSTIRFPCRSLAALVSSCGVTLLQPSCVPPEWPGRPRRCRADAARIPRTSTMAATVTSAPDLNRLGSNHQVTTCSPAGNRTDMNVQWVR